MIRERVAEIIEKNSKKREREYNLKEIRGKQGKKEGKNSTYASAPALMSFEVIQQ